MKGRLLYSENNELQCYELVCTVMCNVDMNINDSRTTLVDFMNKALLYNEYLSDIHLSKGYKYYTYCNLYPVDQDNDYKKGKVYIFNIRSCNKMFIENIKPAIKSLSNEKIYVIASEIRVLQQHHILELETLTPVIVTIGENDQWEYGKDISILNSKLHNNLKCKYENVCNVKLPQTELFFSNISITNSKTILIRYKKGYFLGNKFVLKVKDDPISQNLAFTAIACGLGEKNAESGGYCKAKYLMKGKL